MDSISVAQSNMREAYYCGAPGIVTSGSAWLLSALVAVFVSDRAGIVTLVLAGMFIFPVSIMLCKLIGCTGKHSKDNPLAPLALEGTIWMLVSIPIAIAAAQHKVEWFFPAMILIIAGRYLTFSTLYGMRIFWIFGAVLAASALVLVYLHVPAFVSALSGAIIEYVFGAIIFATHKAKKASQ